MLLPADAKPHTGTWRCPICAADIPVTFYGITSGTNVTFIESPWPMADVAWHVASEHPGGSD